MRLGPSRPKIVNLIEKQALYFQTSSSTPVLSSSQSPFGFSAQSPTAASISVPAGLSSFNLPANTGGDGGYKFKAFYSSKSALDAAYSNGTYALTPSGGSPFSVPLTGDLYPVTPQVASGGTWQNGLLVIDPAQTTTLTLTTFTGYGSGAGSHEDVDVASDTQNDSYDNDQQVISVAFAGLSATPSPITTITIPAGSLTAGNIYQGSLTFDAVSSLTQSPATVGLFSTATYFYVVAKSATTIPPPVIVSAAGQPVRSHWATRSALPPGSHYNGSSGAPTGDSDRICLVFQRPAGGFQQHGQVFVQQRGADREERRQLRCRSLYGGGADFRRVGPKPGRESYDWNGRPGHGDGPAASPP